MNLLLGVSKVCVTPSSPLRLCGFASRQTEFDAVAEDIFIRAYALRQDTTLLFLYGDFLAWGGQTVAKLRHMLHRQYGIDQQNIHFFASHNHSGPPTGGSVTHIVELPNPAYAQQITQAAQRAAALALEDMEPVTMERYDGNCRLNIYRRKSVDGEIKMVPNPEVPADTALTLAAFRSGKGLKGLLIHYTCHANVAGANTLHPDYPGIALGMLDEQLGCTSLFLQGCCGDLRPNCVVGEEFMHCDYQQAKQFAQQFARHCIRLLGTCPRPVEPALSCRQFFAQLPLTDTRSLQQVSQQLDSPDPLARDWALRVCEKDFRCAETLEVDCIRLGAQLTLVTLSGEAVQAYGQYARQLAPGALCVAYANGMIGYLCTAQQIAHGGYEPKESAVYFGINGTFPPETEARIKKAMVLALTGTEETK